MSLLAFRGFVFQKSGRDGLLSSVAERRPWQQRPTAFLKNKTAPAAGHPLDSGTIVFLATPPIKFSRSNFPQTNGARSVSDWL